MKPLIPNGKELDFAPYIITEDGRVYSKWRNKLLKAHDNGIGYLQCYLKSHNNTSRWYKLHRLVALLYVSNPENKPEVNHLDGNKANNHFSNLAWCTHKENIQHSFDVLGKKNSYKRGKDNPLYGKKQSKETKEKQSKAKLGELHPKFKGYYTYQGVTSTSMNDLAKQVKCSSPQIARLLKKGLVSFIPKQ
jgi:hypothetical protein